MAGDKFLAQQGDVIVEKVDNIKGKKLNHLTLAQGEHTGNHHTITKGDAELYEDKGTLYLRVLSDVAELTHQEHNIITIPKGDFIVKRIREFDHFAEEARQVRD